MPTQMPDNSDFQPWGIVSGESRFYCQSEEGDWVSLQGIGNFTMETRDMAGDDRLDLNRLIRERQGFHPQVPLPVRDSIFRDEFFAGWVFEQQQPAPEPPPVTMESLNRFLRESFDLVLQPYQQNLLNRSEAIGEVHSRIQDLMSQYIHSRPTPPIPLEFSLTVTHSDSDIQVFWQEVLDEVLHGREDRKHIEEDEDPSAEFTRAEEKHFNTAKERLNAWMARADELLADDGPSEPEHAWLVEAHHWNAEDGCPDDLLP